MLPSAGSIVWNEAETAWNKARELEPGSSMLKQYDDYLATVYLNKGLEAGENKDINDAILYLEKAVQYDPNNPNAWYNLGGAYFTAQQFAKAKSAFTQSLQLDPNQPNAQQALSALGSKWDIKDLQVGNLIVNTIS